MKKEIRHILSTRGKDFLEEAVLSQHQQDLPNEVRNELLLKENKRLHTVLAANEEYITELEEKLKTIVKPEKEIVYTHQIISKDKFDKLTSEERLKIRENIIISDLRQQISNLQGQDESNAIKKLREDNIRLKKDNNTLILELVKLRK